MSIPNFFAVDESSASYRGGQPVYRGGQPVTPEDWQSLVDLGITQVIKLNEDSEGSDEAWTALGRQLYKVQIPLIDQLIIPPSFDWLNDAVAFITPGTFVHCLHGQDRTGLVCALYRFRVQKWNKTQAEEEMLARGFHRELFGLWEAWERAKQNP